MQKPSKIDITNKSYRGIDKPRDEGPSLCAKFADSISATSTWANAQVREVEVDGRVMHVPCTKGRGDGTENVILWLIRESVKGFPLLFPPLYPLYENTGVSRGDDQSLRATEPTHHLPSH